MLAFNNKKYWPKISKIGIYLSVFWILFLLGRAIWQNWQLKTSIWQLNEQLTVLSQQKKELTELNVYYNSNSFKELEARKQLGLKKVGEKMVVLPQETIATSPKTTSFPEEIRKEKESIAGVSTGQQIPNWLLWWQYFTK